MKELLRGKNGHLYMEAMDENGESIILRSMGLSDTGGCLAEWLKIKEGKMRISLFLREDVKREIKNKLGNRFADLVIGYISKILDNTHGWTACDKLLAQYFDLECYALSKACIKKWFCSTEKAMDEKQQKKFKDIITKYNEAGGVVQLIFSF